MQQHGSLASPQGLWFPPAGTKTPAQAFVFASSARHHVEGEATSSSSLGSCRYSDSGVSCSLWYSAVSPMAAGLSPIAGRLRRHPRRRCRSRASSCRRCMWGVGAEVAGPAGCGAAVPPRAAVALPPLLFPQAHLRSGRHAPPAPTLPCRAPPGSAPLGAGSVTSHQPGGDSSPFSFTWGNESVLCVCGSGAAVQSGRNLGSDGDFNAALS